MATYQSPGVYVEETDSGNKPIEGVSTSTAGVVGVTERGPANVPTLLTSFGDFQRLFGGYLSIDDFTDPGGRAHCYLPHAVEGFFTNGGQLMYVTRVTATDATRANRHLFYDDPNADNPAPTVLLRPAHQDTGTLLNPPLVYVLSASGLSAGSAIRIGDGSRAEYRDIVAITTPPFASLSLPLQNSHSYLTATVATGAVTPKPGVGSFTLLLALTANTTVFDVSATAPGDITALVGTPNQVLQLGPATPDVSTLEYVVVKSAIALDATHARVTLANPLQLAHPVTDQGQLVTPPSGGPTQLAVDANGGDSIVFVTNGTFTAGQVVVLDAAAPTIEVRRVGTLTELQLAVPAYEDYPVGSQIQHVTVVDDTRPIVAVDPTMTQITFTSANTTGLLPGMTLSFATVATPPSAGVIQSVNSATGIVTIAPALGAMPSPLGSATVQQASLTAAGAAGAMTLQLGTRIGLDATPTMVLRIGTAPEHEIITIAQLPDPHSATPDPGAVVLVRPLARSYPAGTPLVSELVSVDKPDAATTTLLDAPAGADDLLIGDGANYNPNDVVRVTTPSGDHFYHVVETLTVPTPNAIQLDLPLTRSHSIDSTVVQREELIEVRALDTGMWGNRVMVTIADEEVGLVSRAEVINAVASPSPAVPSTLNLSTLTGVEAGTVLEMLASDGTAIPGNSPFLKVKSVDRSSNNLVVLDAPGVSADQVTAFAAAGPNNRLIVRSREFRMQVLLLAQPNPAIPIRNDDLLDQELFRSLSMDPRHSHYFERTIGSTWTDGSTTDDLGQPLRRSDHRSEGTSQYVRVHDLGVDEAHKELVRLGPEDLIDVLPSGLTRPARLKLGDGESSAVTGSDKVSLMGDDMYIGDDDNEPANRTGIYALQNQQDISLIAVPGQVTGPVQQALIDQCENMLYRFAVLDAQGPDDDTIDDVQTQRQQFDTKYAAFYHPWLTIADPFPTNLQSIAQFPIPPSGHMLGIYARVDESRGVHKAPANEVVGGMTGLTRYLNQSDQDVLNAEPVNIDVIRDFRLNNRGIRVWGARVITSDSDWKYINVRRLMIFIEASLNQGLQWVVFEPNDETLWGRVRRSVSNFLTTVWRNGALEGDTKDQAFYVKCDRTTMTQDDLDNGRLICVVGVAPVYPAEFVIIRIGLWTADASS